MSRTTDRNRNDRNRESTDTTKTVKTPAPGGGGRSSSGEKRRAGEQSESFLDFHFAEGSESERYESGDYYGNTGWAEGLHRAVDVAALDNRHSLASEVGAEGHAEGGLGAETSLEYDSVSRSGNHTGAQYNRKEGVEAGYRNGTNPGKRECRYPPGGAAMSILPDLATQVANTDDLSAELRAQLTNILAPPE